MMKHLDIIFDNIRRAAEKAGRNYSEIEVIAASKTRSIEAIREILADGRIKTFGENRVQELLSKYDASIEWDMIGRLQTNKVKYIIDKVRLIHSADRVNLLEEIDKRAAAIGKCQDILIEINTGDEENKGGIEIEKAEDFASEVLKYPNVRLRGLMAVAPLTIEQEKLRDLFLGVNEKYLKLKKNLDNIDYLSMGMSNDYELAVECGANMVRLGRILF